jgi:hypothetical protein
MGTPADDVRRADAAWAAARRMIARRERPCYRVAETGDGTFNLVELPWIAPVPATPGTALARARDAVAGWLGVDPEAFDIERG